MNRQKLAALALAAMMFFGTTACGEIVTENGSGTPTSVTSTDNGSVNMPTSGGNDGEKSANQSAGGNSSQDTTSASDSASSSTSAESMTSTSGGSGQSDPQPSAPEFLTTLPIPSAYTAVNTEKPGTVETITYQTKVYDISGNGTVTVEKKADVYLPYGYDQNGRRQYNVLYLMHGGGETYTYWLTENKKTVNMLDNMFATGKAEPCIVVAPTFYTNAPGSSGDSMSTLATDVFRYEFRNDLVPAVESTYCTYARGDVSESGLIATRTHRGYAGLSMGSMVSIRSIILGCLDICAYVNSMSGGYAADDNLTKTGFDLIKEAMTVTYKSYRVEYWINHNGNNDMALGPHESLKNMILNDTDLARRLKDGRNFKWIKFPTGSHSYDSWIAGTYNCLLVFFK